MASAVHLMANEVHPSEASDVHDCLCSTLDWLVCFWWHHVRLLIYMIGYADHLIANAVHPSEASEEHPSVVSDVRWWPLQYTWWQMQYTQVRLLKCTPVLFLMLDDGLCSTLDGKCSTPKRSFWCTWWHIQYTCWHIQDTIRGSWFTW